MLINGNGQTLLRFVLPDDIFIEKIFYILRFRKIRANSGSFRAFVVVNDLITDVDAFITDVNAGTGDQLSDIVLGLAAKRTAEKFFWSSKIRHKSVQIVWEV
jgi:hypothetical protein